MDGFNPRYIGLYAAMASSQPYTLAPERSCSAKKVKKRRAANKNARKARARNR